MTTPHPDDPAIYEKMASIGLKSGEPWKPRSSILSVRRASQQGLDDARAEMKKRSEGGVDARKFFGTREQVGTDYMNRAMGVYMGIFGNVPHVSVYLSMPDRRCTGAGCSTAAKSLNPTRSPKGQFRR